MPKLLWCSEFQLLSALNIRSWDVLAFQRLGATASRYSVTAL